MKTQHYITLSLAALIAMLVSCSRGGGAETPSLADLDEAIANRPVYFKEKEARIDSLKRIYSAATDPRVRFDVLGALFGEYHSYNADSSLSICRMRQQLAQELGDRDAVINADLNMAEQLILTGSYLEATEMVKDVHSSDIPEYLHPYLYHIKRTVCGLLHDSSVRESERQKYLTLTDVYRDSMLSVNDSTSLIYCIIDADRLNTHGEPQQAVEMLTARLNRDSIGTHDVAIAAFTLSESYRRLGDKNGEKRQLIISSINDMKSAVKEYIALRQLALLLYQEGDVNHAYKYLRLCMRDAQDCNARQRLIEISNIFPIVNDVYFDTIDSETVRFKGALVVAILLALFLMVAIYLIYRQMRKTSAAHRDVAAMNSQLKQLNDDLNDYNKQLSEANKLIAENSNLKEEYIGRYMEQCLIYIEKLDAYRKTLNKLALAGRIDEIKRHTKSVTFIDGELKTFYDNFDTTFLRLFPTFVEDFNALLRPDEQLQPKAGAKLNTELRIFALIRLGITDSVKIAQFLRYSVTTIYNYRTRVRNRAINRNSLEDDLMKIGLS